MCQDRQVFIEDDENYLKAKRIEDNLSSYPWMRRECLALYKHSAQKGNIEAMYRYWNLVQLPTIRPGFSEKVVYTSQAAIEMEEGRKFLQKAADLGHVEAQYNLFLINKLRDKSLSFALAKKINRSAVTPEQCSELDNYLQYYNLLEPGRICLGKGFEKNLLMIEDIHDNHEVVSALMSSVINHITFGEYQIIRHNLTEALGNGYITVEDLQNISFSTFYSIFSNENGMTALKGKLVTLHELDKLEEQQASWLLTREGLQSLQVKYEKHHAFFKEARPSFLKSCEAALPKGMTIL